MTSLLVVWLLGCTSPAPVEAPQPPEPGKTIVLVTLDTTRADALGCYGQTPSPTPFLDQLAAEGLRIEEAQATVPLTLPSHSSMFTGLYPDKHGVRDNIGHRLPDAASTLAEALSAQQWATGAVIASAVLEGTFGLDQGFDHYEDGFDLQSGEQTQAVPHRRGEDVVARALQWLGTTSPEQDVFVWVHLFDPHQPLQAPEPFRSQQSTPYLAEVAYADAQVRAVHEGVIAKRGSATFVVVGDHGEALGEHGEPSHGQLVYRSTMAVPMILWGPEITAEVRPGPASVADVMPTVLGLAGVASQASFDGVSLLEPQPAERIVYGETFYPRYQFGMSELRVAQDRRWRLISGPSSRLFDLASDRGELTSVLSTEPAEAERLQAWLDARTTGASARVGDQDEEVARALAALGYLTGPPAVDDSVDGDTLLDPMAYPDMVARFEGIVVSARTRPPAEGAAVLEAFLEEWPRVNAARLLLSRAHEKAGNLDKAVAALQPLLEARPSDLSLQVRLAELELAAGDTASAVSRLQAAHAAQPQDAGSAAMLAELHRRAGDCAAAREVLAPALARHEHSGRLLLVQGACALDQGDLSSAETHLRAVIDADPNNPDAPFLLGRTLAARGDTAGALPLFRRQVELTPAEPLAVAALGASLYETGAYAEALPYLEAACEHPSTGAEPWILRADAALRGGTSPADVLSLLEHAAVLAPSDPRIPAVRSAALMAQGDVDAALREMKSALRDGTGGAP